MGVNFLTDCPESFAYGTAYFFNGKCQFINRNFKLFLKKVKRIRILIKNRF